MIYIHTAMPAEAEALISHYRLIRETGAPVEKTWRNDTLCLIVSGPGKLNAATAVALTGRRPAEMENPCSAWLNTGTAWHAHKPPGEVCLAHSVTDGGSGQCWYPQIVFPAPCPEAPLITEDYPAADYADQTALHDMEAAGFYAAALKFTHMERIHSLKVVSDNRAQPITAKQAATTAPELMTACLPILDTLIRHMKELNQTVTLRTITIDDQQLIGNRCTVSERRQLTELLRQWRRYLPDEPLPDVGSMSTRRLLTHLRSRLHEVTEAIPP